MCTTKSTLFVVSKDEWDTKDGHEECIVHTVVYQKAHLGTKQHQTVKNQAHSLSCYRVMLVRRHQLVSQSVSQSVTIIRKINIFKNSAVTFRRCFWSI